MKGDRLWTEYWLRGCSALVAIGRPSTFFLVPERYPGGIAGERRPEWSVMRCVSIAATPGSTFTKKKEVSMTRLTGKKLFCRRCKRMTIHIFSLPREMRIQDDWRVVSNAMCISCGFIRLYTHSRGQKKS